MFLTYEGRLVSTDETYLFDATESLTRRGNLTLNLTNNLVPLRPLSQDPFMAISAVPLFWLVEQLPGIGMVQGMLLFNNLVTATTAGLIFFYALTLGYRTQVALTLGLVFGLGTIAWPYSKTFFREPLMAFFLLLSAYALERWRRAFEHKQRHELWLATGVLAFLAAHFTKSATLLAIPALLIIATPRFNTFNAIWARMRQLLLVSLVAVLVLGILLSFAGYKIAQRIAGAKFNWIPEAVGGYLISPGKSLFIYSPVLLLGLAGMMMLAYHRKWRYVLAPVVLLAGFVLGYAILQNINWFGGQGWGARYMVPLTGFLLLPSLPVIAGVMERDAPRWTRVFLLVLILFSIGIQIVGTTIPVASYSKHISGTAWTTGVWVPAQTHIAVNLRLLSNPDEWGGIAWWHLLQDFTVPTLCIALMIFSAAVMFAAISRQYSRRHVLALTLATIVMVGGIFGYALKRYTAADTDYLGNFQPLHEMLAYLDQNVEPGEVVLLNNPRYRLFFYTFNKRQRLHIVTLPHSPGEQPSPDQPAERISENPDHLIRSWIPRIIHTLADEHPSMWLVIDSSPFIPWSVRPVEQWMVQHYYPIEQHRVTDQVRTVRYSTVSAPPPAVPPWPAYSSGAIFGDALRLTGYDLIEKSYQPGETVNLSLVWQVQAKPQLDFNVGLFLLDAQGFPALERHSAPVGGFGYTSQWEPSQTRRDNHALLLPLDIAPGTYTLRVILYNWQDGTRLPVTGPNGEALGDAIDLDNVMVK